MGYRRRTVRRAGAVLAALALAGALTAPAAGAIPILPGPGVVVAPHYLGAPSTAAPLPSDDVPQNPYLAPNGRDSMHDDAYATDAYAGPGPTGTKPRVTSAMYGVTECATIAFDAQDRIVGMCPDLIGPTLKIIDPVTLRVLGSYRLPNRNLLSGANPLSDLCGGAYFYLDNQDRAVVATTNKQVQVVAEAGTSFTLQRSYDLGAELGAKDCVIALLPDWSGRIWFVSQGGVVGTITPDTGAVHALRLDGEQIVNSFAADETGGVYIVSDRAMYRFDADASGAPAVTWRQPYDRGAEQKPGQLSQGSGTTPTLVGRDLVAITDNADPRMNVIFYNRATGQELCQAPVFAAGASNTENSVVAVGDSVIVENNYGYRGPQSTLLGKTTAPGIARVQAVSGGTCNVMWTNQESAPTSVPKVSLASGLLYVYTKPKNNFGLDEWYFTAIDVRTGATVYKQLTGTGIAFNNHYAAIYLGPDGSAYIATLTGLIRIHDSA
ncbi:MAG TPA: hypothetical protein VFE40_00715 [Jatrophihabitantaceae bacterium]|jgi:hypothetical protein|nr:hypothetical protein [Jatrophihabitantaceae bacterium]